MDVYLDVLLIINFIVNAFLLLITSQTLRIKASFKYILIAAILGSMYVITLIFPSLIIFSKLPFKIIMAVVMILITFRKKDILFNLKASCIFILYSMVLAGMCIAFSEQVDENFNGYILNFKYENLFIGIMIIYMVIYRIVIFLKDRRELINFIYIVDIVTKDYKKRVKAFFDTGNELREPATNLPVMLVEREIFKDVDISKYDKFYIPYKVVNGYGGKLEGFKPDCIKIYFDKKVQEREVIIAFCENKLSNVNDYEALLSRGTI